MSDTGSQEKDPLTGTEQPFVQHLKELRDRLVKSFIAVAVMCAATAGWSPARAEAWLRQAGTADEYAGLYRAVREFRPPSAAALARAVHVTPESVDV